jgi:predicted LPLAT superfamily acyltransferase
MEMTPEAKSSPRNPGPSWGYRAISVLDRILPEAVFRSVRVLGTWSAVLAMPAQRRHSRSYLRIVLGREPRMGDIFGHFFAVSEALILRLRVANGRPHLCVFGPGTGDFATWLASGRPGLLGTFHIGDSDLTGFMLAGQERKRVHIVRLRVGNSHDTEALAARFGDRLNFIWVNDPGELLFALKEAGSGGDAVALQCDRPDHSSRSEAFDFLGATRRFPFTIYHLALIFGRPVLLSFGTPGVPGQSVVHASPIFEPVEGEPRSSALARARQHFQDFLSQVEAHLRQRPHEWLNFLPLP